MKNIVGKLFNFFKKPDPDIEFMGSDTRIAVVNKRFYPQIKTGNKWITILAIPKHKWYEAPNGFTGYKDIKNAEIILEWYNELRNETK